MTSRWFGVMAMAVSMALAACGGGDDEDQDLLTDATLRCDSIGTRPFIANGTACVSSASTPVLLLYVVSRDGSVGSCSGFKVAPGRVLTAAHCVDSSTTRVVAALWDDSGNISGQRASRWITHPQFVEGDGQFENDVAVITFADPLPSPAMPILGSQPSVKGQAMFIAGWGAPDYQLSVGSARIDQVTDDFIRITYDGELSNACPGDSGGPAYRPFVGRQAAVGLVSSGTGECAPGGRTFFTNLYTPKILDFIRTHTPGLEVL